VAGVGTAKLLGQKEVHRLGYQLFAGIAEQALDLAIDQHDLPISVHQQEPAGGRVDDRTEERLEWLAGIRAQEPPRRAIRLAVAVFGSASMKGFSRLVKRKMGLRDDTEKFAG
jgi:hypothetical protein